MALAFMLNPARKKRKGRRAAAKKRRPRNTKWARCMRAAGGDAKIASNLMKHGKKGCRISAKARKALKEKRAARKVGAKRAEAMRAGMPLPSELFKNPRRKRRGRKGGSRSMAKTKRKKRRVSAKRSRAAKKGWRTWKRRHKGRKPRVGRKGRRNNPKGRRRNLWRDDAAGHRKAAKKGWRRRKAKKNPRRRNARRRRNSMYSGRLYANPRRRRNARRRRNPFGFGGTFGQITKSLTDPKVLTQFAVGAAGASVSEMLGSLLTAKIASFSPETFAADPTTGKPSMVMQLLGAASRIATGVLVAAFLPSQYKMAWILGSGTVAAQPLISGLLKPVLDPIGEALGMTSTAGLRGGIGGWISAAEVYGMRGLAGRRGMGAWLTARQLPGVGVSGLGYGGAYGSGHYAFQPGMQSAFTM